jgi:hypothetical protein
MLMLLHQMMMMMLYKISTCTSISNDDQSTTHVNASPPNKTLSNARLKNRGSHQKFKEKKKLNGKEITRGGKMYKAQTLLQVLSFSYIYIYTHTATRLFSTWVHFVWRLHLIY